MVVNLTKRLPRGAIPSPRSALAAAVPHAPDPKIAVPASFLMWPIQMSSWNNYIYGDCVSAEEAFAKADAAPQTFIPAGTVVSWARANGYLQGAVLIDVLNKMQTAGFPSNSGRYDDGVPMSVDWTNSATLQSAIYSNGPVKIGVGASYFQSNSNGYVTPGASGWAMYSYPKNQQEDHCVSLCGYGTLAQLVTLFHQHGVTVNPPSGMPTGLSYAVFTWNSIGIIDQQSMLNMTYEAWIRKPVTALAASVSVPHLIWQNTADGAWNWYGALPNGATPVAFSQVATGGGNGNLQAIGLGANDALPYLIWQSNADGAWHWHGTLPNASNPVTFSQFVTGVGNGGNLQVVGLGANDGLAYLIWQNNANGTWNWYGSLPNSSEPVAFSQIVTGAGNENLQVIGLGAAEPFLPYLIWQNTADGAWNWYGVLPNVSNPVGFSQIVTGVGNGNLQLIGIGAKDGLPYLIWQNNANGAWNWYGALPNASSPVTFSQIATGVGNGNLQLIGLGSDGLPYLIWQNNVNGTWNWYGVLPNASSPVTFSQVATGVGSGGNLQVIGIGANDGLPYLIWQTNANGTWNWYGVLPSSSVAFRQIGTAVGSGSNLQVIALRF